MPTEPDALHRFPARCGRRASMFRPDGNWAGTWSSLGRCCRPTTITTCAGVRSVVTVVTELPPFLAAEPIRERSAWCRCCRQYPLPEWSINLIYPPHRHPSTIVRTYLDFCQSYLSKIVQACEIGIMG